MNRYLLYTGLLLAGIPAITGCSGSRQPVNMSPPVAQSQGGPSGPMGGPAYNAPASGQVSAPVSGGQVWNWQDVPANQNIPIVRATFDQSGYQLFAGTGETIVVPFANNNLYVMKFGRTNEAPYFRNEVTAPVLYLSPNDYLENASAQNARWYPLPQDFAYSQPVYVGLAPTWNAYTSMGWYPGMNYYGGMWGYTPFYNSVHWMPAFYINIGGCRYNDYGSYSNYYRSTPGYVRTTTVYNYPATRSTGSFGSGRSSAGFGNPSGSTGSFGNRQSARSFGNPSGSTGSFGAHPSGAFGGGTGTSSRPVGSFGGGGSVSGSSGFGGGRAAGGSFGGGRSSGSGGSFGGGRSSGGGGSFGGGRSSGGGGSFGGGHSSSFGGGRRR